jgi:hypothetical protein
VGEKQSHAFIPKKEDFTATMEYCKNAKMLINILNVVFS